MSLELEVRALAAEIAALRAERKPTPPLLDAEQVAAWLGVKESWVLTEARAERLPCVRLGKYVRFRPADIDEWIDSRAHHNSRPSPNRKGLI